jgi:hypothetical protein
MNSITKEQALFFSKRWQLANAAEIELLRETSFSELWKRFCGNDSLCDAMRSKAAGISRVHSDHSYRSACTGFAVTALIVCQLTLSNAMISTTSPESENGQNVRLVRNAKFCSHLSMTYQAIGQATRLAVRIHFQKSVVRAKARCTKEAPRTCRTPSSFFRLAAA